MLLNPTAHAVEREYRVLAALSPTPVPAPKVIILCEDCTVLDTPFYVMEFVAGRIFSNPSIPGVLPAHRKAIWHSALTTLALLHRTDIREVGLGGYGKPTGFYTRQIRMLATISAAQSAARDVDTGAEVGPILNFAENLEYFSKTLPEDRTVIIHGDYKIDNLIFHPVEPRVVGILDWELSTLGHPLSDLCNLVSPFLFATNPEASMSPDAEDFLPGKTPGLPSMEEAVKVYEQAVGWKVHGQNWGLAFMLCRNSVITQGITARFARRQASSENAGAYVKLTPKLAALATRLIKEDREERGRGKTAKL